MWSLVCEILHRNNGNFVCGCSSILHLLVFSHVFADHVFKPKLLSLISQTQLVHDIIQQATQNGDGTPDKGNHSSNIYDKKIKAYNKYSMWQIWFYTQSTSHLQFDDVIIN